MTTTKVDWGKVTDEAHAAGVAAAEAATPTPMVVYESEGLSDRPKAGGKSWYVPQGPCGFAWVKVAGNTAFARWVRKNSWGWTPVRSTGHGKWDKAYGGGYSFWVSEYGQSVELKSAYAGAYAKVLENYGVRAYAQSRLD